MKYLQGNVYVIYCGDERNHNLVRIKINYYNWINGLLYLNVRDQT
ncbi:MAG: hypothetical protein WC102_08465 [Saccharofermentanales bacterium]